MVVYHCERLHSTLLLHLCSSLSYLHARELSSFHFLLLLHGLTLKIGWPTSFKNFPVHNVDTLAVEIRVLVDDATDGLFVDFGRDRILLGT